MFEHIGQNGTTSMIEGYAAGLGKYRREAADHEATVRKANEIIDGLNARVVRLTRELDAARANGGDAAALAKAKAEVDQAQLTARVYLLLVRTLRLPDGRQVCDLGDDEFAALMQPIEAEARAQLANEAAPATDLPAAQLPPAPANAGASPSRPSGLRRFAGRLFAGD